MHIVGIPLHWGFTGAARKGFGPNSLTPYVGDANIETPEYKAFLVDIEPSDRPGNGVREARHEPSNCPNPPVARRHAAAIRPQDLHPPLGLDVPAPPRQLEPRSRSSSTCRSASAARPASRPASNGTTCARRSATTRGVYDNPQDLTPDIFTLMRFTEWDNPGDRQSRMADPQGRLHALRGSGLPQGLPGARRHRAVLQRHRRLRPRELHRLRLLHQGMPVQHPAHLQGRPQRAYKCTLCSDRVAVGQGRPAPRPARPRRSSSAPRRR